MLHKSSYLSIPNGSTARVKEETKPKNLATARKNKGEGGNKRNPAKTLIEIPKLKAESGGNVLPYKP